MPEENEASRSRPPGSPMKDQIPRSASHATQKEGSLETSTTSHPEAEATSILERLQGGGVKTGATSASNLVAKAFEFIEESEPKGATLISVLGLLCLLDIMGFAWIATGPIRSTPAFESGRDLPPDTTRRSTRSTSPGSIDVSTLSGLLSAITSLKSGAGSTGGVSPPPGGGKGLDPTLLTSLLALLQQGGSE